MENLASKKAFRGHGNDVSLDYFLYSCFEHERFKKTTQKAGEAPKPSPFAEQFADGFGQASPEDLFDAILDVVSYYKAQYPDFGADAPLSLANINDVIPPFIALCWDFAPLFATPATEEGAEEAKAVDLSTTPAWKAIEKVMTSSFPRNNAFYLKFLYWTYVEKTEEADEVGSRPPLGRFSPYYRPGAPGPMRGGRPMGRSGGGRPGGDRGDRGRSGGRRDGGRGQYENREGREGGRAERESRDGEAREARPRRDGHEGRGHEGRGQHEGRGEGRSHHENREGRGEGRGHHENREGRGEGRGEIRGGRRREGRRPQQQSQEGKDPRLEAESIAQVVQAAQYLRENPGVEEFRLPPTNSYYRLLQHQQVKKEGFYSRSVGEGPERALMVTRSEG